MITFLAAGTALLISPIALDGLVSLVPVSRWELLSEVGQAYGAVAALVSTAALLGVIASVAMQARSTRVAAEQGLRTRHFDLIRIVIDNPALTQAGGRLWRGPEDDLPEQLFALINLWITHFRSMYELRLLDEAAVREGARQIFEGEAGRQFWIKAKYAFLANSGPRARRAFYRLIDEEFHKAQAAAAHPTIRPKADRRQRAITAAVIGSGVLVALSVLAARRRR
ncbi:DUF6082 family protein [Nonomuraea fuscirosea]|uniref:DUF6082 family protein n=1 Tax=Nonomuraea fuscirosea TaxID=1291556 RepID=UPI0033EAEAE9